MHHRWENRRVRIEEKWARIGPSGYYTEERYNAEIDEIMAIQTAIHAAPVWMAFTQEMPKTAAVLTAVAKGARRAKAVAAATFDAIYQQLAQGEGGDDGDDSGGGETESDGESEASETPWQEQEEKAALEEATLEERRVAEAAAEERENAKQENKDARVNELVAEAEDRERRPEARAAMKRVEALFRLRHEAGSRC